MPSDLKAIEGTLTIVAVHSEIGFSEKTYPAVSILIRASNPDFSDYFPGICNFVVCFKPESAARAQFLMANLRELRARHNQFSDIGVGHSEGLVVYEHNSRGSICSMPLGDRMNVAFREAMADSKRGI